MSGHVSLLTLRDVSFQVHMMCPQSCRTHLCSSWLFYTDKLWARNSCLVANSLMLPIRRGRTNTFQVHAAKRGFGAQPKKKTKKPDIPQEKDEKDPINLAKEILASKQATQRDLPEAVSEEAPAISVDEDAPAYNPLDEEMFERRLAEIKRVAEEKKVLAEEKKFGPIDYDAPPSSASNGLTDNLGAKIGIGVAVVVFGLIFALGDFLPSGKPDAGTSSLVEKKKLSKEESSKLQAQVKEFTDILKDTPEDRDSLEGAAVSYAELGEFEKAEQLLTKITQKFPSDPQVIRLLAEVQNGKGDYDASVTSYRSAIRVAGKKESLSLIQGLTDTLLESKKPSEAVGELLAARTRLKSRFRQAILPSTSSEADAPVPGEAKGDADTPVEDIDDRIDPITVELLLGKAYAAWSGHTSDAVSVYDGLIASNPDDYRGYLAKGVLLKGLGKTADAERMFIQARYLAPANSKSIVDIYSGRKPS